jgi:hypothetical protein
VIRRDAAANSASLGLEDPSCTVASVRILRSRRAGGTGPGVDPWTSEPENELRKVYSMLYTIAVVLLILWILGLVTSYTMGGFIHILIVVAIVMVLVNLISGRRSG